MLVFFAQVLFQRRPAFADVEDLPSAYARLRDGAELQHFRPDFRRVCTIFCPDSHRANWLEAGAELLHDVDGALKPCGACYAATQFKGVSEVFRWSFHRKLRRRVEGRIRPHCHCSTSPPFGPRRMTPLGAAEASTAVRGETASEC